MMDHGDKDICIVFCTVYRYTGSDPAVCLEARGSCLFPAARYLDDIRVGESTEYRRSASSYLVAVRYVYVGSSDIVIKAPAE